MAVMKVTLHIERLILDGLPMAPDAQRQLQVAVEAELARLLASGGLAAGLSSGGALAALPAGAVHLAADQSPAHLGRQIAQAVYEGLGR